MMKTGAAEIVSNERGLAERRAQLSIVYLDYIEADALSCPGAAQGKTTTTMTTRDAFQSREISEARRHHARFSAVRPRSASIRLDLAAPRAIRVAVKNLY